MWQSNLYQFDSELQHLVFCEKLATEIPKPLKLLLQLAKFLSLKEKPEMIFFSFEILKSFKINKT